MPMTAATSLAASCSQIIFAEIEGVAANACALVAPLLPQATSATTPIAATAASAADLRIRRTWPIDLRSTRPPTLDVRIVLRGRSRSRRRVAGGLTFEALAATIGAEVVGVSVIGSACRCVGGLD